jgi:hypothetical protein
MLGRIARGLFLFALVGIIAAYAVSAATATPPPLSDSDVVGIQWC